MIIEDNDKCEDPRVAGWGAPVRTDAGVWLILPLGTIDPDVRSDRVVFLLRVATRVATV